MKLLITGGAGFIGSHLAKYHIAKGDSVWIVDNLSTGSRSNLPPQARFDETNLLTFEKLPEAIAWADAIYHMAAIVGQKVVLKTPTKVLFENSEGCRRVLETVSTVNPKARVLIASSSEVYNYTPQATFRETDALIFPSGKCHQVTYPLSKFVDETTALSYFYERNTHAVIARLFNTTGPFQAGRYGMVVPTLIRQAQEGVPLTIYGDGRQTRSFCSIHDMVRFLEALLMHPKSSGEIYNVGNNEEISILSLAEKILTLSHSSSTITFIPYEKAYGMPFTDIPRRCPDLTKFNSLGLKHQYSLDDVLLEMISMKN